MITSWVLWLGVNLFLHNLWVFLTVFLTKGVILFGVAYAATRLLPSLPAEHKHTLWFLIVLGFVLLPLGRLSVPVVPISLPESTGALSVSRLAAAPITYSKSVASVIDSSTTGLGGAAVTARHVMLLLPAILWLLGVGFFVVRYVAGSVALRRLASSRDISPAQRLPLRELARRMGIHRRVSCLCSSRCRIPLTYGWLHPRIVLPADSRAWPDERLKAVLVHELTHIKRADSLRNALVYLVCAFLWFNPFVWLAREFMLRETEMICDRSVLSNGMTGTEYASTIVDIVRSARGRFLLPWAHGITGRKTVLKERILRILTLGSQGQSGSGLRLGRALLFCFFLLVPLFAITFSLKAGEKLYGTWVGPGVAYYSRLTWDDDGKSYLAYDASSPDDLCNRGEFTVEKRWRDPNGDTWYNLKAKWSWMVAPWYALIRVEQSGKVCEFDASYDRYPSSFSSPLGAGMHQLYVKK